MKCEAPARAQRPAFLSSSGPAGRVGAEITEDRRGHLDRVPVEKAIEPVVVHSEGCLEGRPRHEGEEAEGEDVREQLSRRCHGWGLRAIPPGSGRQASHDLRTRPGPRLQFLACRFHEDHGQCGLPVERGEKEALTLWRWRDAFQNDFAARMDWTVMSYEAANHPPVPPPGEEITVRTGEYFALDGSGTTDPDGDALSYLWFHYPEAGTYAEAIGPYAENLHRLSIRAPEVDEPETTHFVLAVTDKGTPALTRYKRVIVNIVP